MMQTATRLTASDIKALYSKALSQLDAAKPDAALLLLGRIIDSHPNLPEPLWQAARILGDADQFDRAIKLAQRAALLKPAEPVVWSTWADLVALSGDRTAEQPFIEATKSSELPAALKLRLQDRFGAQRCDTRPDTKGLPRDAVEQLKRLIEIDSLANARKLLVGQLSRNQGNALLHTMLATIEGREGKGAKALQALRTAQKLDPYYAEAWVNEALELRAQKRDAEAVGAYRMAIAKAPGNEKALLGYVTLRNQANLPDRARPYAERLVALHPKSLPGWTALGNTLTLLRDYSGAEEALDRAIRLSQGKSTEALVLKAQAITNLGREEEALDVVDRALAIKPDHVQALNQKAHILQSLGRFADAEGLFRKSLEFAPDDGELWRGFVTGFKVTPDDPVIDQMKSRISNPDLSTASKIGFAFALGKALEDTRQYDQAFEYIRKANDLVHERQAYDMAERKKLVASIKEAMRGFDWKGRSIPDACKAPVIFVTGMPRSGTTLVEQILSSHSRVTGAGELGLLQTACQKLLSAHSVGVSQSASLNDIPSSDLAQVGWDFVDQLKARFPDADIISDKSISTYMHIGLVKLILPNSKVIVVRRDPRDTLLSIYKNRFPDGTHLYGYDLRDLAHVYATFVDMINFWREEVPDQFFEIQYESLVANPEIESRRLIEACDLDWEDACLSFHENKRKVETLSVYQVRQPISRNSVKSWQRYEKELAPMFQTLAEYGLLPD